MGCCGPGGCVGESSLGEGERVEGEWNGVTGGYGLLRVLGSGLVGGCLVAARFALRRGWTGASGMAGLGAGQGGGRWTVGRARAVGRALGERQRVGVVRWARASGCRRGGGSWCRRWASGRLRNEQGGGRRAGVIGCVRSAAYCLWPRGPIGSTVAATPYRVLQREHATSITCGRNGMQR